MKKKLAFLCKFTQKIYTLQLAYTQHSCRSLSKKLCCPQKAKKLEENPSKNSFTLLPNIKMTVLDEPLRVQSSCENRQMSSFLSWNKLLLP